MNYAQKCFHKLTGSPFTLPRAALSQTIAALMLGVFTVSTLAEKGDGILDPGEDRQAELARATQNPVASLISVPFENNATFNNGKDDDFVNILNIKPVIPMGLSENWNWINRIIAPVITD
jgi:hypothetical protein